MVKQKHASSGVFSLMNKYNKTPRELHALGHIKKGEKYNWILSKKGRSALNRKR